MDQEEKAAILENAKTWFRIRILEQHVVNAKRLANPDSFIINPFLTVYLANFLKGDSSPDSIARALIYPRVLGTSITTSFGTNVQNFTNDVLSAYGSTTSGIDIEYTDQLDNNKKYCQLKAGPNTINSDDVETISGHFSGAIRLARTNNVRIAIDDMVVGVIYGEDDDLSAHYKRITEQYHYPVIVGNNFWHRLTGDANFYHDLIRCIGEVAVEADYSSELEHVINELAATDVIMKLSGEL